MKHKYFIEETQRILSRYVFDENGKVLTYWGLPVGQFENCERHGTYPTAYKSNSEFAEGWSEIEGGCPHCLLERLLETHGSNCDIPRRFWSRSLANYIVTEKWQRNALDAVLSFTNNLKTSLQNGRSIAMLGAVGTGKTHLAVGVAMETVRAGYSAKYTTVSKLISTIRDSWKTGTTGEVMKSFINTDLLIIDEVGVQSGTENEKQLLFDVLNERYGEMKSTIILSNLPKDGVVDFLGRRVWDRLSECDGIAISLNGESYRSKVKTIKAITE